MGKKDAAVRRLEVTEHGKTRALWEEVFAEDEKAFLDYYYEIVAAGNRIYVQEDGQNAVVSMVQLNPYRVHLDDLCAHVYYVVGVATKEEYRHQGRMRSILQASLGELQREKIPFVYLVPAAERIYLPFGFRTVAMQNTITIGRAPETGRGEITFSCRPMRREQIDEIAEFSKCVLARYAAVYAARDRAYFERMWLEQEAVCGGILLFYYENELAGYCFTGDEGGVEIWEMAAAVDEMKPETANAAALRALSEYFKDRLPLKVMGWLPRTWMEGIAEREVAWRPLTMVRIVDLESFAVYLRATEAVEFTVEINDAFLPANNGSYHFRVTPDGGCVQRLERQTEGRSAEESDGTGYARAAALRMDISEFAEICFGVRKAAGHPFGKLRKLSPVYLNELV